MTIQAVVFDAYGTLFDVYSIGALAEQLFPGQGAAVSALWRDKQIEYSRLITLSDPNSVTGSRYYQSFGELTRRSLLYTLEKLKLPAHATTVEALMGQYAHLTPFAENVGVLQQLKAAGIPTAILSNGSPDMLASAVQSAGMASLIGHVLSVDGLRLFKTAPQSYALVLDVIQARPEDILFVSSNAWDALGATWFGFTTLWVNRQGLPHETIGPKPHFTSADLSGVLAILHA